MTQSLALELSQACAALLPQLPAKSDWLQQMRQNSLQHFQKQGFPTLKDEQWRYSDLRAVLNKPFAFDGQLHLVSQVPSGQDLLAQYKQYFVSDGYQAILVDGQLITFDDELAELQVQIMPLSQALVEMPDQMAGLIRPQVQAQQGFSLLNSATMAQGVYISVDEGVSLNKPIEILAVATRNSAWVQPRTIVALGKGAALQLVKHHISTFNEKAVYMDNSVSDIVLAEHASLQYCLIQDYGEQSYQVDNTRVNQASDSTLNMHTVSLNSQWVRNDLTVNLNGADAKCAVNGLSMLTGKQHVDNNVTLNHDFPDCQSRQCYKSVLDQRAHGVFRGLIRVDQNGQGTDAEQSNPTLLLSDHAQMDSMPQLEIYADDVSCAHGATMGQLDDDAMFYMRSRGMSYDEARALLIFGFLNEVVETIEIKPVREFIRRRLTQQLAL